MNGKPCSSRSKMSTGLVSVPEVSIFSFSQIWGSGKNGASPSVRQSNTRIETGSESMSFIIISHRDKKSVSGFLQLRQPLKMPLLLGDNEVYLPAGIVIVKHSLYKLVEQDRILFKRF